MSRLIGQVGNAIAFLICFGCAAESQPKSNLNADQGPPISPLVPFVASGNYSFLADETTLQVAQVKVKMNIQSTSNTSVYPFGIKGVFSTEDPSGTLDPKLVLSEIPLRTYNPISGHDGKSFDWFVSDRTPALRYFYITTSNTRQAIEDIFMFGGGVFTEKPQLKVRAYHGSFFDPNQKLFANFRVIANFDLENPAGRIVFAHVFQRNSEPNGPFIKGAPYWRRVTSLDGESNVYQLKGEGNTILTFDHDKLIKFEIKGETMHRLSNKPIAVEDVDRTWNWNYP